MTTPNLPKQPPEAIAGDVMAAARKAVVSVNPDERVLIMSGHYDDWDTVQSAVAAIKAERERLRPVLRNLFEETVWNDYNLGVRRDGKWMDAALSGAEHLRADLGFGDGWHDDTAIRAAIPALIDRKVEEAITTGRA